MLFFFFLFSFLGFFFGGSPAALPLDLALGFGAAEGSSVAPFFKNKQ